MTFVNSSLFSSRVWLGLRDEVAPLDWTRTSISPHFFLLCSPQSPAGSQMWSYCPSPQRPAAHRLHPHPAFILTHIVFSRWLLTTPRQFFLTDRVFVLSFPAGSNPRPLASDTSPLRNDDDRPVLLGAAFLGSHFTYSPPSIWPAST